MTQLTPDQSAALLRIEAWLDDPRGSWAFLLFGSAGTGKTFCMQQLRKRRRMRMVFTAPTNKATRVLRQTLRADDYSPECKTIYSLLGLTMSADGEMKEIVNPDEPVDLSKYDLIAVDEAGMVNSMLYGFIREAAQQFGSRVLFLGDAAQLPPVKEDRSLVWQAVEGQAELTKVMRQDNQILTLATTIRGKVDHPAPTIRFTSDNNDDEGVWVFPQARFYAAMLIAAERGDFSKPDNTKVIAWRNVTVDRYNLAIRRVIYGSEALKPWLAEDRVIFSALARDLEGQPMAATDDEGTVLRAVEGWHPEWPEFKIWNVSIDLDFGGVVTARVLHPEAMQAFARKKEDLAVAARADRRKWKSFWEFCESFHSLRHAYAITAHRAQGSTYQVAYVDWRDVLLNRNRQEAFRCLYVACTRPKQALVLN